MSAKVVKIKEEPQDIRELVEIKKQNEEIDGFVEKTKSPKFRVLKIELKTENNDCSDENGTKSSKPKNKIFTNKQSKSKTSVRDN